MGALKLKVGPADRGRRMTLDEFAEAEGQPGYRYELSDGVIQVVEFPGLSHGQVILATNRQIIPWAVTHGGVLHYYGSGDQCVIRLPGLQCELHPDLSFYLSPSPGGEQPWDRWIPDIVLEVVSAGGETRDYDEKRREYLAAGVREYWILDPIQHAALILQRAGDVWREHRPADTYATALLPGFTLDIARLFGGVA